MHSVGEASRAAGSPAGGISPRAPWSRNIASISRIVRRPLRATSSRLRARRPRAVSGSLLSLPALRLEYAAEKSKDDSPHHPRVARIAFDVSRAKIAGVDRESIRDACAILDPARNPLAARAFQHVSFRMVGDDKSAAVAEINIVLPGAALPVAFDQRADNFGRFACRLRALESEPHEIHPEQTRRRQRLAREHRFVATSDSIFVESMLQTPEPERPRADHGGSLGDLRNFEILTVNRRARGMDSAHRLKQRLAFARRAVGILGQQRRAVAGVRREHDHGIAGREHKRRNCMRNPRWV